MEYYLAVLIGGGLGSLGRYALQGVVHRWAGAGFPYGTLTVNVLGSFLIGLLAIILDERFLATPVLRVFLLVGILGGFTTFSSFSYETAMMFRNGEILLPVLNIAGSVVLCLLATATGMAAGKLF
jgi:CrcB protein